MPGIITKKSGLDLGNILKLLGGLAVFVPFLGGYIEYKKSVEDNQNKNFREIVGHLTSTDKNERLASATNLGTFIKTDDPKKNDAIDILVNMLLIETNTDILQAISSSLKRFDPKKSSELVEKLLVIDRTAFAYQDALKEKLKATKELNNELSKNIRSYNNFREILALLSSSEKTERIYGANMLGAFVEQNNNLFQRDNPFNQEVKDTFVYVLGKESDNDVLQAITSSLGRLNDINYNSVYKLVSVAEDVLKNKPDNHGKSKIGQLKINKDFEEKTFIKSKNKEPSLGIKVSEKEVFLAPFYKNYQSRYEENINLEKELDADIRKNTYRSELISKFIIDLLSISKKYPIDNLELYQNTWNYATLPQLQLPNIKIKLSTLSDATIYGTNFRDASIEDSTFSYSRIMNTQLEHSQIKASLFDKVRSLKGTKFTGATFKDVVFAFSNVGGADFTDVKGLEPWNFYKTENWDQAKFDPDFKEKLEVFNKQKEENQKKEFIKQFENSTLLNTRQRELKEDLEEDERSLKSQIGNT